MTNKLYKIDMLNINHNLQVNKLHTFILLYQYSKLTLLSERIKHCWCMKYKFKENLFLKLEEN